MASSIPNNLSMLIYCSVFLKNNATQFVSQEENQMTERFFLKHVNDKGDHILVDEQLNITGIID